MPFKTAGAVGPAKRDLTQKLDTALTYAFNTNPSGSKPMHFDVKTTDYYFPSLAQSAWNGNACFKANIDVIDDASGQTLASFETITGKKLGRPALWG